MRAARVADSQQVAQGSLADTQGKPEERFEV
jgi:hypothetical protein